MAKKKNEAAESEQESQQPETDTAGKPPEHGATVGRSVHYHTSDVAEPYSATVTKLNEDGSVGLAIFDPSAALVKFKQSVGYSDSPKGGHWNWPPKK
jgi:hypothetical protein